MGVCTASADDLVGQQESQIYPGLCSSVPVSARQYVTER